MKLSDHFSLKEFVPADIYKHFGEKSIWFVDKRNVAIVETLRVRLDLPIFINTWWMEDLSPGDPLYFEWSGYRPRSCTIGSENSQHRCSRATDPKTLFGTISPAEGAERMRDDMITHYEDIYKDLGLTTIEHKAFAPTWAHNDTRWTNLNHLLIVKP